MSTIECAEVQQICGGTVPLRCRAVFERCEDGSYCVYAENLPGVTSAGKDLDEAREEIISAFRDVVRMYRERGKNPPFETLDHWTMPDGEVHVEWITVDVG